MKAIHNKILFTKNNNLAVVNLTKVQKMKAIHNLYAGGAQGTAAVVNLTKVQKMKAIHNPLGKCKFRYGLL